MKETFLKVNNLEYYYQDGDARRYIFKDINYEFKKGCFYVILGESGAGKTTFLSILSGMDTQTSGEVEFYGKSIKEIGLNNYRRNNVGMIFQSYNLIPYMTSYENTVTAMSITNNKVEDMHNVAYNLLDFIGITKTKANRKVTMLSGGEQQRVAIARALATNADLILADEPTGNLDKKNESAIMEIFKSIANDYDKCVIVVTHSKEVANYADSIIRLSDGDNDE